ncbi:MAG: hypothetical protein JHC76_13490 [Akkermansiaceae bacterium]|nr:hypothetical protein [Akkermansiaceae bacterium]
MKIKNLILGTMFAGFAASASAQTTDITITGATAFRTATLQAIYDAYDSVGNLGTDFFVCHSASGNTTSNLTGSNQAVFKGTFPGITGTTYIRTAFNGSTEGLNAIAGNNNPAFLTQAAVNSATSSILGGVTTPTETLRPKFSFSDVYQSTSPVDNVVLNPVGSSAVGVVAFCMIANEGAPADLTNVTIQQARALWANGIQPLSLFTGDPTDTSYVFATGRNDGSGTRAACLTEWSFGVANLVNQYIATSTGATGTITKITAVPANGLGTGNFTTSGVANASTLWGNTNVGNGGYSSSSSLRTLMGLTSANVTVFDGESQTPVIENQPIQLITWLSSADSLVAATAGAKILGYNGVLVTPITSVGSYLSSGFSEADFKKIATGAYSPWSYQHLYFHGSLSGNEQTWYNAMKATWIPSGLQTTSNGVRLGDLTVSRPDDGFPIVAPL